MCNVSSVSSVSAAGLKWPGSAVITLTVLTDYARPDIRLDRTVTNAGERTSGTHPAFDRFGRTIEHMWVDGNFELLDEFDPGAGSNIPPVLRITHTYDKASNRLTRYDETPVHAWDHRHQEFEYDGLHRLKTARRGVRDGMTFTHAGGNRTSEQWDLDPIGNWTERRTWTGSAYGNAETRQHSDANELTQRTLAGPVDLDMTYDAAGNLRTREVDDGTSEITYVWDAWNRLVRAEFDSEVRAEYEYNGLTWRIRKRADMASPPAEALTQERVMYYSASWQLLEERITDGLVVEEPATPEVNRHMQYIWGNRYIDDIALRRQNVNLDNDSPDVTYEDTWYHLTDALFSTVVITNHTGVIAERVSYSPYGTARHHRAADLTGDGSVDFQDQTLLFSGWGAGFFADLNRDGTVNNADLNLLSASWGAAETLGRLSITDNIIGFAGYVFNAEFDDAGLYTVRYRHYEPELGRWLSRDPLGYVDGMGVYEYVRSNTVKLLDPSGRESGYFFSDPCLQAIHNTCWQDSLYGPLLRQYRAAAERACGGRSITYTCQNTARCRDNPGFGGAYEFWCGLGGKFPGHRIVVCPRGAVPNNSRGNYCDVLVHEFVHARQICEAGLFRGGCKQVLERVLGDRDYCMQIEMEAYYLTFECRSSMRCCQRACRSCGRFWASYEDCEEWCSRQPRPCPLIP